MRHFLHTNGSVESTPPSKRERMEAYQRASRDDEYGSREHWKDMNHVNRLAYSANTLADPYKYKYFQMND